MNPIFIKIRLLYYLIILFALSSIMQPCGGQENKAKNTKQDTTSVKPAKVSKFDSMNKKMEALFKIIPAPIFSHSVEAGNVFGLAKFDVITLSKFDKKSANSYITEMVTFSTLGRININGGTELNWHEGKYMVMGSINYKRQPEYIIGIGNDVKLSDLEQIEITRLKVINYGFIKVADNLYVGIGLNLTNYNKVKTDSISFLIRDNISGLNGGLSVGIGASSVYDSRDLRTNPTKGMFVSLKIMNFPAFLGNPYLYTSVDFDIRKYFNPWYRHVIAVQATTSFRSGDVPFYDLALMGGSNQMRGFYEGGLRDKVLVDSQIEYRMPVWNIFGITGWIGNGRVGKSYSDLALDGFWTSFGVGLRIRVDTEHNTNLRFDYGFTGHGINGLIVNLAEAF
jgi:hypothetical protein